MSLLNLLDNLEITSSPPNSDDVLNEQHSVEEETIEQTTRTN